MPIGRARYATGVKVRVVVAGFAGQSRRPAVFRPARDWRRMHVSIETLFGGVVLRMTVDAARVTKHRVHLPVQLQAFCSAAGRRVSAGLHWRLLCQGHACGQCQSEHGHAKAKCEVTFFHDVFRRLDWHSNENVTCGYLRFVGRSVLTAGLRPAASAFSNSSASTALSGLLRARLFQRPRFRDRL